MCGSDHNVSNESIDFQKDDFIGKLTGWVDGLREIFDKAGTIEKASTKEVNKKLDELKSLVKKRFNISLLPAVISNYFNMSVNVMPLTKNTGAVPTQIKPWLNIKEFYKSFEKEFSKAPVGWVDTKNATVHGVYENIDVTLLIGLPLVLNKTLTSREVAASMLLHEIGHVFDIFANVSQTESYTKGMSEVHRALTNLSNPEDRKVILEYLNLKNYIEIPHENIDKITNLSPDKAAQLIVIERQHKLRSQTGITSYENQTAEQSADLFVARFGGSKDAVSSLSKVGDAFGKSPLKRTKTAHYSVQALGVTFGLLFLPVTVLLLVSTISSEGDYIYDTEKDRLDKLRQQLLVRLKNKNIDPSLRTAILNDLEVINEILSVYKDNVSWFTAVARLFSKKTRTTVRQNELMYHLERMSNNKLFESASKLKSLL